MAHFIGTPGDFQKERAISRRVNALAIVFAGFTLVMFLLGAAMGFLLGHRGFWSVVPTLIACALARQRSSP